MDKQQIVSFINENMFGIWFLIGAALVFWMQAGFAMVETGFTRAKNVHPDRFFIIAGRRCSWFYRKTGI